LKHTTAQHPDPATQTDLEPAQDARTHATVYTFVIWDHDRNATVIYPRMATLEAIARMRGKVNEDSAWVVDASALDVEGFYSGTAPKP
jgi:hypothetical protein